MSEAETTKPRKPREFLSIHLSADATNAVRTIAKRFGRTQEDVLNQLEADIDVEVKRLLKAHFDELKAMEPTDLF